MARVAVVALVLVFFSPPMARASSYPTQELVTVQPDPITLSRPPYLQPTALPTLETSIVRISDSDPNTFDDDENYYRHYYSTVQAWNSDGTRLLLGMDPLEAYFLDGKTFEFQFTRTDVPYGAKWSNSDPDVLFGIRYPTGWTCCTTATFGKYLVSSGTWQPLHTFSEFNDTWLGDGKGNLSDDDRYAPLVGKRTPPDETVVIWDTVTNTEVGRKDFTGVVGWAAMSPSGNYVVVSRPGANSNDATYEVYDKYMTFQRVLTAYAGGHADIGYDSAGNEVIVWSRWDGGIQGRILFTTRLADDVHQRQLPPAGVNENILPPNNHISCRNTLRPGYCYIGNAAYELQQDAYLFHEVFAVKLDGSGLVERYSQDFAAEAPIQGGPDPYYRACMVTPNRDGSLVLFSSDWRDPSSSAVVFDYVAGVDQDGDGVFDVHDNCVDDPNPLQGDDDEDGVGNACDPVEVVFTSIAAEDGDVTESTETSGVGGSTGATVQFFHVGDMRTAPSTQEKQQKGILSFDTSTLPDDATIESATLTIKQFTTTGTNPFLTHGSFAVDVHSGGFGGSPALAAGDFEASATVVQSAVVYDPSLHAASLINVALDAAGSAAVSTTDKTQLRLYFTLDDNDDDTSDFTTFHSSNAAGSHPKLTVEYVVP